MNRKLQDLTSTSFQRRDEQVILKIGATVITRAECRELKWDLHRSARALTRAIARHPEYKHAKNAKHLARMASADDLMMLDGIGEYAIIQFCLILTELDVDALKWYDSERKIVTRYAQANTKPKLKRRYEGRNLVRGRFGPKRA